MSIISKLLPVVRSQSQQAVAIRLLPAIGCLPSVSKRSFATEKGEITKAKESAEVSTDVRPLGEKIKETTKTISYTGVILVGVGVTGVIFYYVFRELFSSNSANSIYSRALEKCQNDPRVEDSLGVPIKGYGEETTRRRRSHVSHAIYDKDGVTHMRMRFYIKGTRNKANVEVDMKQNEYGNYEFRYILAQLDDYSRRVIIVEDNRADVDKKSLVPTELPILNLSH